VARIAPSASRYLTTAHSHTQTAIAIIEDEDDAILLDICDSIEADQQEQEGQSNYGSLNDGDDDNRIEEPSPKRRRISLSSKEEEEDIKEHFAIEQLEDDFSSSLPILSPPPASRLSKAPRFLITTAPPSASESTEVTQTFLKPPRFRPPDPSITQQAQPDPLPEHFSPHRRGQKYMLGGLAAEVRDWLVNFDSALPATSAQKKGNDPWLVRVLVEEMSGDGGDGMTLVRGQQVLSSEMRVILAGEGQHLGLQKGVVVTVGKTVGIQGPIWEVVLDGVKWSVGLDWKVLP
jgi:hypothetical protein